MPNTHFFHVLQKASHHFHIPLTKVQLQQYDAYMQLLQQWNSRMNLTAIVKEQDILVKHFVDSLSIVSIDQLHTTKRMIDVGTGAGFPGIPLAIAFPHIHVTLLDSLQKRIYFLKEAAQQLHLTNVTCIHGRAEEYGQNSQHREQYDLCISRAVARMAVLSEYCLPFVQVGGVF
ncbi:MAG TPA: 16S rRNA (guanine(527)-N(7))-methyltransferase RsmG, partial [Patescibacteria group bacterium]|nr:16S rRNA (guanine(527)-N(7))-methyltransferase RsmG [Patescibacteria group bacterium]